MPQPKKNAPSTMEMPIAEAKIKPRMHPSFLLGTFSEDQPPTGFSIAIHPDPNPVDSVITRVARSTATDDHYKLILHVTNNSAKTIGVKIHKL